MQPAITKWQHPVSEGQLGRGVHTLDSTRHDDPVGQESERNRNIVEGNLVKEVKQGFYKQRINQYVIWEEKLKKIELLIFFATVAHSSGKKSS